MSLQQVITTIQQNNYGSLVILTAVGYDYILTFPEEIEYIWNKPWTSVSTLFVLVRYFGLCNVMIYSTWGTTFFPGTVKSTVFKPDVNTSFGVSNAHTNMGHLQGSAIFILAQWSLWIFICAADLTMILRVWALYTRSRFILGALLVFYAVEIIAFFITYVIIDAQSHNGSVAIPTQVLNSSFCVVQESAPPIWGQALDVAQITLGAVMCLLVVIQFVRESLQMYKVTKRLQLCRYMNVLVREGMIYFIAILGYALFNILGNARIIPTEGGWFIMSMDLQQIPPFTLVPRFILGLRELYARNTRLCEDDIDTAFGLNLRSWHGAAASASMFIDNGNDEDGGHSDEVQTEQSLSGSKYGWWTM